MKPSTMTVLKYVRRYMMITNAKVKVGLKTKNLLGRVTAVCRSYFLNYLFIAFA